MARGICGNFCRFSFAVLTDASAYSPIPVPPEVRGPEDPLDVSAFSGAPIDLKSRAVKIYKPAKTATQSGHWNGRQWRMDWDALGKGMCSPYTE